MSTGSSSALSVTTRAGAAAWTASPARGDDDGDRRFRSVATSSSLSSLVDGGVSSDGRRDRASGTATASGPSTDAATSGLFRLLSRRLARTVAASSDAARRIGRSSAPAGSSTTSSISASPRPLAFTHVSQRHVRRRRRCPEQSRHISTAHASQRTQPSASKDPSGNLVDSPHMRHARFSVDGVAGVGGGGGGAAAAPWIRHFRIVVSACSWR